MGRARLIGTVGVVALLAIGALGYLLLREGGREADAGPRAADAPAELPAAIIGDSYTSGFGLDDPASGYAYHLADALGWRATVDGFPGSGFTEATPSGDQAYADRVAGIPQGSAIAVIQGGLNDTGRPDEVRARADEVLRAATGRAARVVVVGPPTAPGLAQRVLPVDAALAAAAADAGVEYVSTLDWELSFDDDGVHLTPAGHRRFAGLLAERLG